MTRRVGPYELLECIGSGGTGTVYRALAGDLAVAVKVVPRGEAAVRDEVARLAALHHPHVVAVHDYGLVDEAQPDIPAGSAWYAMPLARSTVAGDPPTTPQSLRRLLLQLLAALSHAHAHGVLHCDVKPSNVLLFGEWPCLADFGVARVLGARGGPVAGTPRYMAPEQVEGRWHALGPATDLYGLGCLAWRLAFDAPVFTGSAEAVAFAHVALPPPNPPAGDLPDGFGDWLLRLLEKDPRDRFPSAEEAAAALRGSDREIPRRWAALEPVQPWEGWTTPALLRLRTLPLVGREPERDALWEALCAVLDGDGPRLVTVRGAAGIGKTALVRWLVSRAREWGLARALTVTHAAVDGPGHGLRAAILATLGDADVETALEGRGVAPPLASELAGALSTGGADLAAVCAAWVVAMQAPFVLWIDDAQWADESVDLARRLLADARRPPVLVVATLRPGTGALLPEVARADVVLAPMTPAEQRRLLRELLRLAGPVAVAVEARAEGHPQLAIELVRSWAEQGALAPGATGYRVEGGADPAADLRVVWRERMARVLEAVPAGAEQALLLAAALGTAVDGDEWADVCGPGCGASVRQALRAELIARHVVDAEGAGLRFVHAIPVEAIADLAGRQRWAAASRRCADVVPPSDRARRGRLWLQAGEVERAVAALREAADEAQTHKRLALLPRLIADLNQALDAGRRPALDPDRAYALSLEAELLRHRGEVEESLALATRAAEAAGLLGDARLHARTLGVLAATYIRKRDHAAAAAVLERAEALAKAAGDRRGLVNVITQRAQCAWALGDRDAALALAEQAVATDGGHEVLRGLALLGLGNLAIRAGDPDRARPAFEAALPALAGTRMWTAHVHNGLGEVARQQGRMDEAMARYRDSLAILDVHGPGEACFPRFNLAMALSEGSAWADARPHLLRLVDEPGLPAAYVPAAQMGLAVAAAVSGHWDQARHWASRARPTEESHYRRLAGELRTRAAQAGERVP